MKINCIVVDDTPLAVEKLEEFIKQITLLNLLKSFNSGIDAISFLKSNPVDLVFLDIQMEQFSGLQFMESLQNRPKIIIVSAYSQYAVNGFDYSVTDYLLKPYSFERFLKSIDKVQNDLGLNTPKDYIFVKTEYRMERINFSDILYIEGQGAYLRIVTLKSKIMTLLNFQNMESLLPSDNFIRVHKSFIVAMNKIESIERNIIKIGEQCIPIGLSYREKFNKKLRLNE
ncbi:MAG: response regulator transcription factor [Candidatus Methanofastidiosa archaeon]|nr:response regulator transcription factor [Candidatus Methanofastidiosa archaeon]